MKFKYLAKKSFFGQLAKCLMRFFLSVTFVIIIFTVPAVAQKNAKSEDVVYLKNGSIIRGTIMENQPGVLLRIRTEGKSEWVFKYEDIEKITKEETTEPAREIFSDNKGLYGLFQAGILAGSVNYGNIVMELNTNLAFGYKFHRLLGVGAGAGIDIIHNITFLPITADVRGSMINKAVTPYYSIQTGYSVPLTDVTNTKKTSGGFIINPALGLQVSLSKDVALLLEAGYRFQNYYNEGKNWNSEYEQKITVNRYNLRFGFIF